MKLKLEIIENLGADATVKDVNNSKAISFSVAHSEKYKNHEGIDIEKTTWVNCTFWKYQGQSTEIAKYLKKGTMVAVEGFPSVRGYQNQQEQNAASLDCRVTDLRLLSAPKNMENETTSISPKAPDPLDDLGDKGDLPF